MIDTHAHLYEREFDASRPDVLKRFKDAGGLYVINAAVNPETTHKSIALALQYPGLLYTTVGLHPEIAVPGSEDFFEGISMKWIDSQYEMFNSLISEYSSVVGVGECGIDYFAVKRERMLSLQRIQEQQHMLFTSCIKLAKETDKPLVVHCRDSEGDKQAEAECLELLVKHGGASIRGVFHSYTGSLDYLDDILNLGFYVSFNGIVTYRNAENVREILVKVPLDRILLETDAPLLVPHRLRSSGIKMCEPLFVQEVAETVAKRKNVSVAKLWEQVKTNSKKLFGR